MGTLRSTCCRDTRSPVAHAQGKGTAIATDTYIEDWPPKGDGHSCRDTQASQVSQMQTRQVSFAPWGSQWYLEAGNHPRPPQCMVRGSWAHPRAFCVPGGVIQGTVWNASEVTFVLDIFHVIQELPQAMTVSKDWSKARPDEQHAGATTTTTE